MPVHDKRLPGGDPTGGNGDLSVSEDHELLRLIKSRDEAALGMMMRKHSALVYSAAFRILRQRPEAQEVTQDVFLALWRAPERFDAERGRLQTWLIILSRSRALDLLRHLQASASRQNELTAQIMNTSPALCQPATCDREILIDELMARLPRHQALLVRKVYFEGCGLGEVAESQCIPLGTVKGRARCALKKLRSELGKPPAS
jgi:RNA polymerase sigma-70 factor (ECF subfamily)